jgi:two-component system response regulator MprA
MNELILIVEDDVAILNVLQRSLAFEGYQVDTAEDGVTALKRMQEHHPDLVILDLMLPGMDGIEVCRRIRVSDKIPILMLTARETIKDRVTGLDAGADDYIVKPFELDELLARVRALLRRCLPEKTNEMKFFDLVLSPATRQATRNKRVINLSAKEYDLLELFLRNPRQVLTREVIFDRVWGYDFGGESNVLDVYVRYLRKKLEKPEEKKLIHTIRGVGYVLRETD